MAKSTPDQPKTTIEGIIAGEHRERMEQASMSDQPKTTNFRKIGVKICNAFKSDSDAGLEEVGRAAVSAVLGEIPTTEGAGDLVVSPTFTGSYQAPSLEIVVEVFAPWQDSVRLTRHTLPLEITNPDGSRIIINWADP